MTCGETSVVAPSLRVTINTLNSVNPDTATTGFEDQFSVSYVAHCFVLMFYLIQWLAYITDFVVDSKGNV